jgi:hypothetical protein
MVDGKHAHCKKQLVWWTMDQQAIHETRTMPPAFQMLNKKLVQTGAKPGAKRNVQSARLLSTY